MHRDDYVVSDNNVRLTTLRSRGYPGDANARQAPRPLRLFGCAHRCAKGYCCPCSDWGGDASGPVWARSRSGSCNVLRRVSSLGRSSGA